MSLKIRDSVKHRYVAFKGANGKKLGELTQEQLQTLATIAQSSRDKSLLNLFDNAVPKLETLQKGEVDKKIAAIPKPEKPNSK
jgi:hypothetical protein